jgi:predicted dienelactone hydrolase
MSQRGMAKRIFKRIAILAILGFFACIGLFVLLWAEHNIGVTLPAPTGPFEVGRAIFDWTDDKTADVLAPVPRAKRELLVWIWYPADRGKTSVVDDYMPGPMRSAVESGNGILIGNFLTRDLSKVRGHNLRDTDVSPQQASYPVVMMRAGASLEVMNYSTLAEDLASHGYLVVGFDAPYRSFVVVFPDGRTATRTAENNPENCLGRSAEDVEGCANRLLNVWASDTSFVLDRLQQLNDSGASGKFSGRLDMTRVGAFGHSFGGAATALFCSKDSRCKAGIDLDGATHGDVIRTGLKQPFAFIFSDHSHESGPETSEIQANIQSIYDRLPADSRLRLTIRGANHFTFTDDGALLKSRLVRGIFRVTGRLGLDGPRQLAITSYCLRSFFDAYLKGTHDVRAKIPSPLYPEIQVDD